MRKQNGSYHYSSLSILMVTALAAPSPHSLIPPDPQTQVLPPTYPQLRNSETFCMCVWGGGWGGVEMPYKHAYDVGLCRYYVLCYLHLPSKAKVTCVFTCAGCWACLCMIFLHLSTYHWCVSGSTQHHDTSLFLCHLAMKLCCVNRRQIEVCFSPDIILCC